MKWISEPLNSICDIGDGAHASLKRIDSGILYLTAKNITSEGIDLTKVDYISEETYKKYFRDDSKALTKPKEGDILYSIIGSIGGCYLVKDERIGVSSSVAIFRCHREKILPEYLYYYIKGKSFYQSVQNIKGGVAQGFMSLSKLGSIEVVYPEDIACQQKITAILSAYDKLIENNQKQIKLLEEVAQRLYKEWFVNLHFPGYEDTVIVDGVPEGWNRLPMSQIGEYLNGFAFKPSDWQEKGLPIIKIKEMGNGISNDTPRNNGERVPEKYLIKAGDILFSWSATLMAIIWDNEDGWLNQHLFKVTPAEGIGREYLLQSIQHTIDEFKNLTTGSTMKHIQRGKLDQVYVNVPTSEIMEMFGKICEAYREEIITLSRKITITTEARDRLLPKLMTGELEV